MNVITVYEWLNTGNNKDRVIKLLGDKPVHELAELFSATDSITCDEAFNKITETSNMDELYGQVLLYQENLVLYHGNKDKDMIPLFGRGKRKNDFGQGFYTTPYEELGKEWAYSSYTDGSIGYLHTYNLNTQGLKILNLMNCDSLVWVAELMANRGFKLDRYEDALSIIKERADKFLSIYKMDTASYDVIVGYRADDKYFRYVDDFVKGLLYRETLDKALLLGNLGLQVFIKSPKAFSQLTKVSVDIVDKRYKQLYKDRDDAARQSYEQLKKEHGKTLIFDYIGGTK